MKNPIAIHSGSWLSADAKNPDQRSEQRRDVFKCGTVHYLRGNVSGPAAFKCDVMSLSRGGGMVRTSLLHTLPPNFEIRLAGERSGRKVVVRWRNRDCAGFAFSK